MKKKSEEQLELVKSGDRIEFVVENVTYTGIVINVHNNTVSVEAEGDQMIRRKKETYKRTVVSHSEYTVLPS